MNECSIYTQYYDNLKEIGKGAFSIVYKGREIKTNELRAIKVINLYNVKQSIFANGSEDPEKEFKECIDGYKNECEIMKICSGINSVKLYEFFNEENNFVLVMELCDNNLMNLLESKKEGFSIEEIYEILKQLNNAFKIMKENNIIHRDLKLENILYKKEENNKLMIKLADYGSSKKLNSLSQNYCNSIVGTKIYMAPELLKEEKYNYKCDFWSLGIIIYRLRFVKSLFKGQTDCALLFD